MCTKKLNIWCTKRVNRLRLSRTCLDLCPRKDLQPWQLQTKQAFLKIHANVFLPVPGADDANLFWTWHSWWFSAWYLSVFKSHWSVNQTHSKLGVPSARPRPLPLLPQRLRPLSAVLWNTEFKIKVHFTLTHYLLL